MACLRVSLLQGSLFLGGGGWGETTQPPKEGMFLCSRESVRRNMGERTRATRPPCVEKKKRGKLRMDPQLPCTTTAAKMF
mmetsp:Transcript_25227/g.58648  ORF Transcript_25227/g.58648 Transcript_25227/m.58648 type:complete len:80 (-) Transcript_25227:282-521(-)